MKKRCLRPSQERGGGPGTHGGAVSGGVGALRAPRGFIERRRRHTRASVPAWGPGHRTRWQSRGRRTARPGGRSGGHGRRRGTVSALSDTRCRVGTGSARLASPDDEGVGSASGEPVQRPGVAGRRGSRRNAAEEPVRQGGSGVHRVPAWTEGPKNPNTSPAPADGLLPLLFMPMGLDWQEGTEPVR